MSSCADVSLFWAWEVLLTPRYACSGVVNQMHTQQRKYQREKKEREEQII